MIVQSLDFKQARGVGDLRRAIRPESQADILPIVRRIADHNPTIGSEILDCRAGASGGRAADIGHFASGSPQAFAGDGNQFRDLRPLVACKDKMRRSASVSELVAAMQSHGDCQTAYDRCVDLIVINAQDAGVCENRALTCSVLRFSKTAHTLERKCCCFAVVFTLSTSGIKTRQATQMDRLADGISFARTLIFHLGNPSPMSRTNFVNNTFAKW